MQDTHHRSSSTNNLNSFSNTSLLVSLTMVSNSSPRHLARCRLSLCRRSSLSTSSTLVSSSTQTTRRVVNSSPHLVVSRTNRMANSKPISSLSSSRTWASTTHKRSSRTLTRERSSWTTKPRLTAPTSEFKYLINFTNTF